MIDVYRKAVYDACSLTGLDVYDYWVTNKTFPYIIISEVGEDQIDYKLNSRSEFQFSIHIFAKSQGKRVTVSYSKQITNVLKDIDGVRVQISSRHFSDVEPNVTHSILTLRFAKYK